jgi:hypothetical protein
VYQAVLIPVAKARFERKKAEATEAQMPLL